MHSYSSEFGKIILGLLVLPILFCLGLLCVCPARVGADPLTGDVAPSNIAELTLDQCIEMALNRNLTLAQSQVKIGIRDEEIREVRATVFPQLGFEANYTRLGNLSTIDMGEGVEVSLYPEDNYLFQLSLTQLLYSGGQVQAAVRLAKSAKEAVSLEQQLTEENIIMAVMLYFNQVLLAEELLKVAEETVATVQAHLDIVRVMHQEGLASEFDLLRTEVELANVKPLLIQSKNRERIAMARLADIIQWDEGAFSIQGALETKPLEIDGAELLESALLNRWELRVIETNRQMVAESVNIARGGYLPSLVFFGNYDWSNDEIDLRTGEGQWNDGWNLGLQANWQLFDGFGTRARVAQAKGNQKLLDYELEKIKDTIKLELIEAVDNYREAVELIQSQCMNVEQARKGLHIAEVRFREGISTRLEVMDSRTALTAAQSQYALAQHNFALARIMLDKAIGIISKAWSASRNSTSASEQQSLFSSSQVMHVPESDTRLFLSLEPD
ncbi:TolC family protein [bacterium]|nr:TolC family protein [bacterium]